MTCRCASPDLFPGPMSFVRRSRPYRRRISSSRPSCPTTAHEVQTMNTRALIISTGVGTVLQALMVVAGHHSPSVMALFAVGGMGFSLVAGVAFRIAAGDGTARSLATGGAVAGG